MSASYAQLVAELESRGMMPDRPPGIETTREGLRRLELSIDPARVVIVAGTNGKGSTCAMLETLLRSAGCHVGLYTSPHLVETTERIRLDGRDVSRDTFVAAYHAVQARTEDLRLSHFEMLTLMAAWCFAKSAPRVDWMLFEVGLGGLWDATNAIPHDTCVITRLGMDHENFLGSTLVDVARAKFGIVSHGATVVHAPFGSAEVEALARETAARTQSQWHAMADFDSSAELTVDGPRFFLRTSWGQTELALAGRRAAENATLALSVFERLGYDPRAHLKTLSQTHWSGRMEKISVANAPCPVYVSGDHNPQGIASLLALLPAYRRKHLHIVLGLGRDKNLDGVLAPIFSLPNASVYLTETPFKGLTIDEYETYRERASGAWADPNAALARVMETAQAHDMILITGSLYLVGYYLKCGT